MDQIPLENPPSPAEVSVNTGTKAGLFLPILLTFLITAALIGGYFGYQYFKPKSNLGSTSQTCTLEAKICPDGTSVGRTGPNCEFSPCPTPTSSAASDWKTYQNTQYGYQLKYPASLSVVEEAGPTISRLVPNQKIQQVTLSDQSLTLKIFYEGEFDHGFEPWELDKRENVTLGDKPAVKTILTSLESDNLWTIYTIENFHSFRIEAQTNKTDSDIADQILSTLTFD